MKKRFALRRGAFALFTAFSVLPVAAQTWTGAGGDNNWSTGANWSGGTAPVSGPATQLAFPVSPRLVSVVDTPWTVNRLDFTAQATVTGQPITFAGPAAGVLVLIRTTIDNPIVVTGPTAFSTLQVMDLNGGISGTGPVSFGAVVGIALRGTSTFTGGATVSSGFLVLEGSMPGPTLFGAGAGLVGRGGTVTGPVTVDPGASVGGTVATGNLTVGGTVALAIDGGAPGQYGSIRVTGVTTLNNATLSLSGSYVPTPDDVFVLVDNDGTDPVVGTFAGLPEGSIVTVNGIPKRLSYVGGTGNDVTLGVTAVGAVREAPTLSWWALVLLAATLLVAGMKGTQGSARARRR